MNGRTPNSWRDLGSNAGGERKENEQNNMNSSYRPSRYFMFCKILFSPKRSDHLSKILLSFITFDFINFFKSKIPVTSYCDNRVRERSFLIPLLQQLQLLPLIALEHTLISLWTLSIYLYWFTFWFHLTFPVFSLPLLLKFINVIILSFWSYISPNYHPSCSLILCLLYHS